MMKLNFGVCLWKGPVNEYRGNSREDSKDTGPEYEGYR